MYSRDASAVLLVICLLFVTACTTDSKAREVAGGAANLVNDFKRATQMFIDQMNNLDTSNHTRLRRLAEQTQAMALDADRTKTSWEVVQDDRALSMYSALTKANASNVASNSNVLFVSDPPSTSLAIVFDPKQFDSLVHKLNALAGDPSFEDLTGSFIDFGKEVNEVLKKDMKESGTKLATSNAAAGQ